MHQTTGWTVDTSTFAARLALIRMRMGWNMKEAARECGLNAQTWRLWEVDGTLPRNHVQVAKQISTRTGADFYWLLLGPDEGGGEVMPPTGQYALSPRLIASVGDPDRTVAHPTRPVRRTRPTSAVRPFTPTAA